MKKKTYATSKEGGKKVSSARVAKKKKGGLGAPHVTAGRGER